MKRWFVGRLKYLKETQHAFLLFSSFFILLLFAFLIFFKKYNYLFKPSLSQVSFKDLNLDFSNSIENNNLEINSSNNLEIYFFGEIPKFNPISPDGLYVWWLQSLVWDKLVFVDKDFIWQPNLAKSWSLNSNRTELSLRFASEIYWSNGRRVDENDFKFSFSFYKDDSFKAAIYKPIFERIGSVKYKNKVLKLRLDPKLKSDPFYATHVYWSHILSTMKLYPADLKKNPFLGTGPYKVDDFSNQGKIKLSLNIKSWFFDSYENLVLPELINVKTLNSESLLNKILNNPNGLILGKDIHPFNNSRWYPVDSKQELVAIVFNLKELTYNDRKFLYQKLTDINDLEKLDFKLRDIMIYGSANSEVKDQLKIITNMNNNLLTNSDPIEIKDKSKFENKSKVLKLKVMYSESQDEVWLTYLNEKLKNHGVALDLIKVSVAHLQEAIFNKKFVSFVEKDFVEDFYPHYLSLHSKGAFNYQGWNDKAMDHDLEHMIGMEDSDQIKMQIKKIKKKMNYEFYEVPIFSYQSAVLWTRNPCKPIQRQFQGLGLIYKAIICADNL